MDLRDQLQKPNPHSQVVDISSARPRRARRAGVFVGLALVTAALIWSLLPMLGALIPAFRGSSVERAR